MIIQTVGKTAIKISIGKYLLEPQYGSSNKLENICSFLPESNQYLYKERLVPVIKTEKTEMTDGNANILECRAG